MAGELSSITEIFIGEPSQPGAWPTLLLGDTLVLDKKGNKKGIRPFKQQDKTEDVKLLRKAT